ncbi:MAG: hypothetical protein IJQ87_03370 [Clostridia bacterium]|nr:hypothetical protein [Clostridia bacterium]
MKKVITLFITVIMAISVFAVSACGGSSDKAEKGTIEGKYTEVKESELPALQERLDGIKVPYDLNKGTAGGSLTTDAELKLTIGGKTLTITASEAFALILDITKDFGDDGLSAISGLSSSTKLGVKADSGFGTALTGLANALIARDLDEGEEDANTEENAQIIAMMALIDNLNIDAELNTYVKDSNVYVGAKVNGIPDAVKQMIPAEVFDVNALSSGVKYVFSENTIKMLVEMLKGKKGGNGEAAGNDSVIAPQSAGAAESNEPSVPVNDIINMLSNFGVKVSADISGDNVKVKLATTETTKTIIAALLTSLIAAGDGLPEDVRAILNSITISKLDFELYVAIENGELTELAAKVDVAVSLTVANTSVSASVNATLNCSLIAPAKINFPSFDGYVNPFPVSEPEGEMAA